jgi:DNA-binding GntR family transcriptional regulator
VTAEPLEATSLVELTVRRLRGEILSGELAPGERIVEEQLTRRFGTSRAPLREALRLLGQQGLVEHLPRRGVRVMRLSPRDIDELFSLRDVLEQFAARCALGDLHARVDRLSRSLRTMSVQNVCTAISTRGGESRLTFGARLCST